VALGVLIDTFRRPRLLVPAIRRSSASLPGGRSTGARAEGGADGRPGPHGARAPVSSDARSTAAFVTVSGRVGRHLSYHLGTTLWYAHVLTGAGTLPNTTDSASGVFQLRRNRLGLFNSRNHRHVRILVRSDGRRVQVPFEDVAWSTFPSRSASLPGARPERVFVLITGSRGRLEEGTSVRHARPSKTRPSPERRGFFDGQADHGSTARTTSISGSGRKGRSDGDERGRFGPIARPDGCIGDRRSAGCGVAGGGAPGAGSPDLDGALRGRERINHMPGAGTERADAISAGRREMLSDARRNQIRSLAERGVKRPRIGADAVCEALLRQAWRSFFGYPGGASCPSRVLGEGTGLTPPG